MTNKECCENCKDELGGGLTMLPLVRCCKNIDCPCHQPKEEVKSELRTYEPTDTSGFRLYKPEVKEECKHEWV